MTGSPQNDKRIHFNPPNLLIYFVLIVAFALTGCGSQDETTDDTDYVSFQIPEFASRLDPVAGILTATIEFNGQSHPMVISGDGLTASINSLPKPDVNTLIQIEFTYDMDPYGPLVVASATKPYDGSNSLNFSNGEYDTVIHDADGDLISNIVELQMDPDIPVICNNVMDTGVLFGVQCFYLDGSGGFCEAGFELAPQRILKDIATEFASKNVRTAQQDGCCVVHSDMNLEQQDWGLDPSDCSIPGPWSKGPVLGGSGCTNLLLFSPKQITLCQTQQSPVP